jgi:chromosome segregation ATPase
VAAIIVVAAGGFYANQLKQERDVLDSQLQEKKEAVSKLSGELAAVTKELDSTSKDLKGAQGNLKIATSGVETRTKQVEAEKAECLKIEGNIKTVSQQKAGVQAELGKYKSVLPADLPPEQIQGRLKEYENKLVVLDQEKKVMKDQLDVLEVELKQYDVRQKFGVGSRSILSLNGHVMAVSPDWRFVVLDIGSRHGLVENYPLIVYRGRKLVGKVLVTSVTPSTSIADILPEGKRDDIQEGDSVVP